VEFGDFFVEVGQGGFERFAVIGVGGGFEVVDDAGAGELKVLADLLLAHFFVRFGACTVVRLFFFYGGDLRFYVFAFPASRHIRILTQIEGMRLFSSWDGCPRNTGCC
jgi:nucleoside-diphosphate-sugar epimerase